MRKISKRFFCIVFSLVLLICSFPKMEVKAADNTVELSVEYLSRAKCWKEAANFLHLGYSQTDIAAEIYAHAVVDNISYKVLKNSFISWGYDDSMLEQLFRMLNEHSHVVNIGGNNGSPDPLLNVYHIIWNKVLIPNNNRYRAIYSSLNTDMVIDVANNSNKNGTKIQLYSKNGTSAQEFEFFWAGCHDGKAWYYIFKKGQFKCLDVTRGIAESGVNIQLYDYNGTDAQQWCIIPAGDGFYYLQNRLGFYMDACGGSSDNGTQIWTYSLNGTSAQKWWIDVN